jgi:hypothetical protein
MPDAWDQYGLVDSYQDDDTLLLRRGNFLKRLPGSALPPADAINSVPAAAVLVVSAGATVTAARGQLDKPFATPALAQAAANSGDVIHVYPGSYTVTAPLGKNGVNWHLHPGATLTATNDGSGSVSLFSDGGSPMTFEVSGRGKLIVAGTVGDDTAPAAAVLVTNASSVITVHAATIQATASGGEDSPTAAIYQTAGTLTVTADLVDGAGGSSWAIFWANGGMLVNALRITGAAACIGTSVNTTATGDMTVHANSIIGGDYAISTVSTDSQAKVWITADDIYSNTGGLEAISHNGGKLYVDAQKVMNGSGGSGYAAVHILAGEFWGEILKISGGNGSDLTNNRKGISVSGGVATIGVGQIEDLGFLNQGVVVTGGTLNLESKTLTMTNGDAVTCPAGTVNLVGGIYKGGGSGKKDINQSGGGVVNVSPGCTGSGTSGHLVISGSVNLLAAA